MGIFSKLKEKFQEKTLYYPGCEMKKEHSENYQKILNKLNVEFTPGEGCCGIEARNLGYEETFRKIARKNLQSFKDMGIKRIITSSSECFYAFKKYKEILPDWDIETRHVIKEIYDRLGKIDIKQERVRIGLHASCYLEPELFNMAGKILENLGYEVVEIFGVCCGNELRKINPGLAGKIAGLLLKQAEEKKIDKLITIGCYENLKNDKIKILDFSEALIDAFGLLEVKS